MIIPDANLLIYACDEGSPNHSKASLWWQKCLTENETIGLSEPVICAFVRIATKPKVFLNPMSPAKAASVVKTCLAHAKVTTLTPKENHVIQILQLVEKVGTAGNLVTDAQIASLALSYDAVVHTADADFRRFDGVRWFNPLTGESSGKVGGAGKR